MNSVRIVVAEDNQNQREKLVAAFRDQRGIELVGAAENGLEAIRLVEQHHPDVLVCDMVMPKVDGFAVLEYIGRMPEGNRPKVIALTALGRDDFITRALHLGVSFYMVKPVDMSLLVRRIFHLAAMGRRQTPVLDSSASLDHVVTEFLFQLGMPAHVQGYHFIRQAVMLVTVHPEHLSAITRTLYPAVAKAFNTTPSRVERSIRHAIAITWERGGGAAFEKMMNRCFYSQQERPTNCELIALLAERIRHRGSWRP